MRLLVFINFLIAFNVNSQIVEKIGFSQKGKASYYPGNRNKAITQSGEVYQMDSLEGGHNHIPFNSLVKVVNLENNKEVIIRINDRVYSNRRILDLTNAAAEKLGFLENEKKVFDVKIEVLKHDVKRKESISEDNISSGAKLFQNKEKISDKNNPKKTYAPVNTYFLNGEEADVHNYGLQVAVFNSLSDAISSGNTLENLGLDTVFIQSGWKNSQKVYRLILGNHNNMKKLNDLNQILEVKGYQKCLIKKHFK